MEMKGEGATLSKWFEAEVSPSGGYQLTKKGKRDKESAESAVTKFDEIASKACFELQNYPKITPKWIQH